MVVHLDRPVRLLVALYGPTSSGKTAMSVELCLRLAREIAAEPVVISADSRQVYRYMDIGTSKTTTIQMRGIRHEMISIAEPTTKYELETYVAAARAHIEQCWTHRRLPLIVGGTAVYVRALLEGWAVEHSAGLRTSLRRDFPRSMATDAFNTLRRLDRTAAARVHPNNYDAVINALMVVVSGSASPRKHTAPEQTPSHNVVLTLAPAPHVLDRRVAKTFDRQMEVGLLDEVLALAARYELEDELRRRGGDSHNQVLRTHGYREFFEVAAERRKPVHALTTADIALVRERAVAHIRSYTRRQRSAIRSMPDAKLVRSTDEALGAVIHRVSET
jgi:tRNA dimethylallyltransferase